MIVRLPEVEAVLVRFDLLVAVRALVEHVLRRVSVGVHALYQSRLVDKGHGLLLLRLNLLLVAALDVVRHVRTTLLLLFGCYFEALQWRFRALAVLDIALEL